MKIYYFGGLLDKGGSRSNIDILEESHFDGVLFTYRPQQGDLFTLIARTMKLDQKIKYMVAIRPHTLSAQYLSMINQSMDGIQPGRLEINVIAGHIKPDEVDFGGIIGPITDQSSIPDRVNYAIDYIKELRDMEKRNISVPNCYISCTNIYIFEEAAKLGYKIILPYKNYKDNYFLDKSRGDNVKRGVEIDLSNKKIMIALSPIIRDTQEEIDTEFPKNIKVPKPGGKYSMERKSFALDTEYFSYDDFVSFIKKLESEGINELLINGMPESERPDLIKYIKKYRESNI